MQLATSRITDTSQDQEVGPSPWLLGKLRSHLSGDELQAPVTLLAAPSLVPYPVHHPGQHGGLLPVRVDPCQGVGVVPRGRGWPVGGNRRLTAQL